MTNNLLTNGKKLGRPPISPDDDGREFDQTLGQAFIMRIYAGDTLHKAAEYVGISLAVHARWRIDHPDYAADFARALETYYDTKGDSLLTAHEDIEDPNRARLYSDNVKWLLSKRDKRYSDKLQLEVEHRVSLADALAEASNRVLSTCYQVLPDMPAPLVESIPYAPSAADSESDSGANELDSLLS